MYKEFIKIYVLFVFAISLSGCVRINYVSPSGINSTGLTDFVEPSTIEPNQIVSIRYYHGGGLPSPEGWSPYNLLEISDEKMVLNYKVPYDKEIRKTELPITKKEYLELCKFIINQGFFNIKDTDLNYEHQVMDVGIYEIEAWICVNPKYESSGGNQIKFKKSLRPSANMPDNLKRVTEKLESYIKLVKK